MFINKRHIPVNNSLNREHGTPVTLSPQITILSILASAGICLHHIGVLIGGAAGGKSESEVSGDERLERGDTSRAQGTQDPNFLLRSYLLVTVWLADQSQRIGLFYLPES